MNIAPKNTMFARLERIKRNAAKAALGNARISDLATGCSVSGPGASLPASTTLTYTYLAQPQVYRVSGGQPTTGSGGYKAVSSYSSASDTLGTTVSRWATETDATTVAVRVGRSTYGYRFLVDLHNGKGFQFVGSRNVVKTSASSPGSTHEYFTLNLPAGPKTIVTEIQRDGIFVGYYVPNTSTCWYPAQADEVCAVWLTDSYGQGANCRDANDEVCWGDGFVHVMADLMGIVRMTPAAIGGTGWATANSSRNFLESIQAGNLAYGKSQKPYDIIFTDGSLNDKSNDPALIQANCLAGLQLMRADNPSAIIIVYGCLPGALISSTYGPGGAYSVLTSEAAVQAAVTQFADPYCVFIPTTPANGATPTALIYGNGVQIRFTAALSAATSATLVNNWAGGTGTYTITFSDGTTKSVTLTNGSNAVSWTGAVTATKYASAYSGSTPGNSLNLTDDDFVHPTTVGHSHIGMAYAARAGLAFDSLA